MTRPSRPRLREGLPANIGAQGFALLVQLVVALVSVPVFAGLWGIEDYGVWLVLYTLPAYLALADLGFVGAAATAMAASVARNDELTARHQFRALTTLVFWGSLAVLVLGTVVVFGPGEPFLSFAQDAARGHAATVVFALFAFALFALGSRCMLAALRASGHYAKGSFVIGATALVEIAFAASIALAGGGLAGAAIGYAAAQGLGLLAMGWLTRRKAPEFTPAIFVFRPAELAPVCRPALAMTLAAIAQALTLQGSVAVLGAAAGLAAVPAFVATRTLARLGIQSVAVISQAILPELTVLRARNDHARSAELVAFNLAFAATVAIVFGIGLALLGPQVVDLWSGGTIGASASLAAIMAVSLVAACLWGPLASFLSAENRQASFGPAMLMLAIAGLALAWPLAQGHGASGVALAMALVDAALLAWLILKARRFGFLSLRDLSEAPRQLRANLARWRKS